MGFDAVEPFLARADKGVVVLCRTSNPGSRTFQDLDVQGKPLYVRVAEEAISRWNPRGNLLLVVGATEPSALRELRALSAEVPFLVPGVGVQGASVVDAVENGQDSEGKGVLISTSRAVLYASPGNDFAIAARRTAQALKDRINQVRRPRPGRSTTASSHA
jgi:orotidine-5'-phosphate decarboxylase